MNKLQISILENLNNIIKSKEVSINTNGAMIFYVERKRLYSITDNLETVNRLFTLLDNLLGNSKPSLVYCILVLRDEIEIQGTSINYKQIQHNSQLLESDPLFYEQLKLLLI